MLNQAATWCFNEKYVEEDDSIFCVRISPGWSESEGLLDDGSFCLVRFHGKNCEVELYDP